MCEFPQMTNEQYRKELARVFEAVDENQTLQYFYVLITRLLSNYDRLNENK